MEQNSKNSQVIFFDGVCGLCNGFVDFVISADKKNHFLFSPLQSDYAQKELPAEMTRDLTSVVLLKNGRTFRKSEAVLEVLGDLGGIWKISALGKILPVVLSNKVYDMVAENRYRLFGKKETCRLPTAEERKKFIL
ncbi:thiol-disulfide oxidoreductase DCC family protein [Peredibacter sp. HCB2-198]|uniref:thiol-disulfide oxidoreductase DCC family protein n=1 Tax=Peredibacter sp. HCB2-198 TaxID=3383025 RepID=UPI0038B63843